MQTISMMTDPIHDDELSPVQYTPEDPMPDIARTTCYFHLVKQLATAIGMERVKAADDVIKEALQRLEGDNK